LKHKIAKLGVGLAVMAVVLSLASGALAAPKQGYSSPGSGIQGQVQSGAVANANQVRTVGKLPFTGLELTFFVGAGLALLLTGGALRRLSKNRA
jgi:hypothetical protein